MMIVPYHLTKTPINLLCELGELICQHKVKEKREENMTQEIHRDSEICLCPLEAIEYIFTIIVKITTIT